MMLAVSNLSPTLLSPSMGALSQASVSTRASEVLRFGQHTHTAQEVTEAAPTRDVADIHRHESVSKKHPKQKQDTSPQPLLPSFTKGLVKRHTNGMHAILSYLGNATAILENKQIDVPNKIMTGIGLLLDLIGVLSLPVPFLHGAVILSPAFWSYLSGFAKNPNKEHLAARRH